MKFLPRLMSCWNFFLPLFQRLSRMLQCLSPLKTAPFHPVGTSNISEARMLLFKLQLDQAGFWAKLWMRSWLPFQGPGLQVLHRQRFPPLARGSFWAFPIQFFLLCLPSSFLFSGLYTLLSCMEKNFPNEHVVRNPKGWNSGRQGFCSFIYTLLSFTHT